MSRLLMHGTIIIAAAATYLGCGSDSDDADSGGGGVAGVGGGGSTGGSSSATGGAPVAVDCPAYASGDTFAVCSATYLTDGAADTVGGVAIGAGGAVLYAGTLRADSYGLVATDLLGGGDAGVLRLSADGRSVIGLTRLGATVTDIAAQPGGGAIAVSGSFGLAVLDAAGTTLIYAKDLGGEADSVDIGVDGTVAVVRGTTAWVYDPAGTEIGTFSFDMNRESADVAVDGVSQTVIVTGFNQRDGGGCTQLQVPFLRGYAYGGTEKWTDYDFSHAAVAAVSECADTRGLRVSIGLDGKLYYVGRSDGGNTVHNRMPRDLASDAPNVAYDDYTNPYGMNGAATVTYIARFDAGTGDIEVGQRYVVRITTTNQGNTMRPNAVTATAAGTVLVAGDSACCLPGQDSKTVNGIPAMPSYAGGGYVLMIPADFQSRLTWTVFRGPTGEAETPIAVATDGNTMALAMQQSETDGAIPALITVDALQSTPGGGASDGWVAVWQAP